MKKRIFIICTFVFLFIIICVTVTRDQYLNKNNKNNQNDLEKKENRIFWEKENITGRFIIYDSLTNEIRGVVDNEYELQIYLDDPEYNPGILMNSNYDNLRENDNNDNIE